MQQCTDRVALVAGAVWQVGHTSQTGFCFSSSSFSPVRKKHSPTHKTLPKKSAGCATPAGMCWAELY